MEIIWNKKLGEYHDLYVQSDTLLLAVPGLTWQACLKKTDVKLELLTDTVMLMIEKGNKGVICQAVYRYAKASNKYINDYDKNIESSYLEYLDANNV